MPHHRDPVFRDDQFDLLRENPPSHNPAYVAARDDDRENKEPAAVWVSVSPPLTKSAVDDIPFATAVPIEPTTNHNYYQYRYVNPVLPPTLRNNSSFRRMDSSQVWVSPTNSCCSSTTNHSNGSSMPSAAATSEANPFAGDTGFFDNPFREDYPMHQPLSPVSSTPSPPKKGSILKRISRAARCRK